MTLWVDRYVYVCARERPAFDQGWHEGQRVFRLDQSSRSVGVQVKRLKTYVGTTDGQPADTFIYY